MPHVMFDSRKSLREKKVKKIKYFIYIYIYFKIYFIFLLYKY